MNREISEIESDVIDSMRAHVLHGYGEIIISIKPNSIRIQEGRGRIYDVGPNGTKREKHPGSNLR